MNTPEPIDHLNDHKLFNLNHKELAYVLLRVGLGMNIFFHGFVRIPKLHAFAKGMTSKFENSMLPEFLVSPMAHSIPIVEVILGAGILLGIKTKLSLTGNALLMIIFIFGSCMIENFPAVGAQMLVLATSVALLASIPFNRYFIIK